MRTPNDIGIELRTRNVHMRQYLGMSRFGNVSCRIYEREQG